VTLENAGIRDAIEALSRGLARYGQPYMLIGGIAVIARGVVRATDDVDATVWGPDVDIAAPAVAEDLIVYKAVAWRERDRSDIERLLGLHADLVDLERIRARVAEFAEVLEQPERIAEFEALLRRSSVD
jgi:hypothetical protein